MQHHARYGSSGELAVFRATRYFDGLADLAASPVTVRQPEHKDLMVRVKAMHHKEESHHRHSTQELGAKTKSNLTPFFLSSVGSPAAGFHKNPPAGIHDEPHHQVSSLSLCGSSDVVAAATAACCRDLGEMVGDRRLQGIRVVRGGCGGEERWVVRCGGRALEEQHHVVHEKIDVGAKLCDGRQVEKAEDGDDRDWGSDTSSDLFELDLDSANNH